MKSYFKDLLIIILLLIFCIPAVKDLFIPGGFTSHDLQHHIIRQASMDKLLSEGQFPPRWSGELNHGYGYPVFLFNYPLPPLIGHLIHTLGWGYVDSVKGVLLLSILISVIGMYLFLRSLLDSRLAAFLGAVFWVYAPVRFLNVYVSAALGNALAVGVVPYLFWTTTELIKTGKLIWGLWGGFALGLLILSHNVSTLMFLPVLVLYVIVLGLRMQGSGFRVITAHCQLLTAPLLLGFGVSAWFWIPATFEKEFIRYDSVMEGFYRSRFVDLKDILYSTWGYGSDFSRQVGIAHWLAIGILVVSIMYQVLRKKVNKDVLFLGLFCLAVFIISIFLMLKESVFLWESLPLLEYVQFPARFLTVSVFMASIAVGLLIKYLPYKRVVFLGLITLVLYANRNHIHINQSTHYSDQYYKDLKTTSAAYDEHLPKWGRPMEQDSSMEYVVWGMEGSVNILESKSNKVTAKIIVPQESEVRLNQFYFPGWEIRVDGQKVTFDYLKEGESYGLPVFKVPSGEHLIESEFKSTLIRTIADYLSIGSILIFLTLILRTQMIKK